MSGSPPRLRARPADPVIACIDCGGDAHLLSTWTHEDPPQVGDLAVYRCADCLDRWDLVLDEPEDPGPASVD